jgi:hypothetical protein
VVRSVSACPKKFNLMLSSWLACVDKALADNNKTPTECRVYQARLLQVNACAKPLIARRPISFGLDVALRGRVAARRFGRIDVKFTRDCRHHR